MDFVTYLHKVSFLNSISVILHYFMDFVKIFFNSISVKGLLLARNATIYQNLIWRPLFICHSFIYRVINKYSVCLFVPNYCFR